MKRFIWIGILFFSVSWLFSVPLFTQPDIGYSVLFVLLGILCTTLSCWKNEKITMDNRYLVFVFPLLLSILIIPYPYNSGIILLVLALALMVICNQWKNREKISRLSQGILFSGMLLSLHTAFLPLYMLIVSNGHRIDILSLPVSFFSNLLGLQTTSVDGVVFVQTIQQNYLFTTTFEKLGFFTWCNIFLGALWVFLLFYSKKKTIISLAMFFGLSVLYLIMRYVTYIELYINSLDLSLLWNPFLMTLSFFPLVLILMKLFPLNIESCRFEWLAIFNLPKKQIVALFMIFVFIFTLVGSVCYHDPGINKNGTILIDEYHSDWEDSLRPIDTEWYGLNSTYNYYSLATWLDYYYNVEQNINSELTDDLLQHYDILVLKCPTRSYSNQEINDIIDFVDQGGGLYLIGDHTDVFGMNTFLNQVAERFNIRFNMDATYELGTGDMTQFTPNTMIAHPIVHHLHRFDFMTSCTLDAPLNAERVIIGNRIIGEPGTYATENFFRESLSSPESEYGLLLQVAAVHYGKGRVVAFSDSTVFSSFCLFSDGYQTFTLSTIDYLNRENNDFSLHTVLFILSLFSIVGSLYLLKKYATIHILLLFIIIGFLSFSVAAPFYSSLNATSYSLPSPHSDYTSVCFDRQYSNYSIQLAPSIDIFESYNNYGTFYVWTQRVGLIPSLESDSDACLQNADILVILNPMKSFESSMVDQLTAFVDNGGRLLVLDSILNTQSTANELLNSFDIHISRDTMNLSSSQIIENLTQGYTTSPYLSVEGGETIIINETTQTSLTIVNRTTSTGYQTGKLVVFTDSFLFNNVLMGGSFTEPTERQLMRYAIEFSLFQEVLR